MKYFENICYYSLDIIEFIECSVALSIRQNNFDPILFNFSGLLVLKIINSNNTQACRFKLKRKNQACFSMIISFLFSRHI